MEKVPTGDDATRELRERIVARLASEAAEGATPVDVRSVAPLAGGACQDNWRVELGGNDGSGEADETLVLRQ